MGYQINEFDWCVMNTFFDDIQCTTLWNVDNLNMSYVDNGIVYSVLYDIDTEYRNILKMTITRGKIHKYLGMTIDYS